MDVSAFKIERAEEKDPLRRRPRKTRIFETRLLGFLAADSLWEAPRSGDHLRPIFLAYLGTDRETHPFTANLRAGAKATAAGDTLQLPRRAPYRWSTQKVPGGLITVAYLPELFHLEPTQPFADDVRFVLAPPRWWIEEQEAQLAPEHGEDAADVARAALFCAFLDRRTPLPLLHDLRFHLQLYRAAKDTGWVHAPTFGPGLLRGRGLETCGLDEPLACHVGQEDLSTFIVEQTSLWHRRSCGGRGGRGAQDGPGSPGCRERQGSGGCPSFLPSLGANWASTSGEEGAEGRLEERREKALRSPGEALHERSWRHRLLAPAGRGRSRQDALQSCASFLDEPSEREEKRLRRTPRPHSQPPGGPLRFRLPPRPWLPRLPAPSGLTRPSGSAAVGVSPSAKRSVPRGFPLVPITELFLPTAHRIRNAPLSRVREDRDPLDRLSRS